MRDRCAHLALDVLARRLQLALDVNVARRDERMDARALRVIDKDESEKDRTDVEQTMLGPEVLDSERHPEIVFKSTSAEASGAGRWTLRGNLTLRGQTRPVTVQVMLKDGRYTGETTLKQTDFGIKPPGKFGVRAKDEVKIEFAVLLAS